VNFVKNSLGTLATLVAVTVLGIAWGVIAARTLGPDGMGVLAIAMLYPVLFFTVGHLTFNIGTIHHIGKGKYPSGSFVANSVFIALTMGIILYIIFAVTLPLFQDSLYKNVDAKYLYIAFIIVPFYLLMYLLSGVLQGMGRIKEYNIINLVRIGAALLALIGLVVLLRFDVMGAVVAFALSYVVAAIIAVVYTRREVKEKWSLDFALMCSILGAGGKIHVGSIATFIYGYVGLMIANYYLSPAMVGYLNVAMTIALFLILIPQAVQVVLYPKTSSSTERDAIAISIKSCRHTIFWTLLLAIVFGLCSRHIILLFAGAEFMPSLIPLLVLLPGVVLFAIAQVIAPLWVRKGWFWRLGGSGVGIAAIGVALQLLLVPHYGVVGSAIASSLTYLTGFLVVVGVCAGFVDRKFWRMFVPQKEDAEAYKSIVANLRQRLVV
jgi:O-antigen/teichoic acid export membrane protein